jgi:D-alanyl-D-alanine carboxypeptidase (penicillin-binding protein 5/6)
LKTKSFFIILLLLSLLQPRLLAQIDPDKISAQAGIVLDADTLEVYWQRNSDLQKYPASITKVLTALVVLENANLDDLVEVSDNAIDSIIGNTLWLEYGEVQSVDNLLHGLLMVSANDAAVALAEHVAGSVEKFALLMNAKAKELGAKSSNFVNPHGLHEKDHITTAEDMALIFKGALANPEFLRIANCSEKTMPWHGKDEDRTIYHATLQALPFPWVIANKNGYTDEAGQTLVYGASKNDTIFIAVLLDSSDIYNDMEELLEGVYTSLCYHDIICSDKNFTLGQNLYRTQGELKIAHLDDKDEIDNYVLLLDEDESSLHLAQGQVVLARTEIARISEELSKKMPLSWLIYAWPFMLLFWVIYIYKLRRLN